MNPLWLWLGGLALYALFSLWYVNWSGPLSAEEIERYMAAIDSGPEEIDPARRAAIENFLESDDGGEFYMANLARLPKEPVADPKTGELRPAREVLREYTGHFMPALFRRAGHPAFIGRSAGSYIEAWGVEADPGWSFVGIIRYRSRRDMMELATNPAFHPAHAFKVVAMTHTLAFPVAPGLTVFGPRVWVGLVLSLFSALGHIFLGRG